MNLKKSLLLFLIVSVFSLVLCSCSRDSMRKGKDMVNNTRNSIDRAIQNGENVVDYGLGALENGMGDVVGEGYYRGGRGMNDGFGANSGYSGYVGNGTGTSVNGTGTNVNGNDGGMNMFPTMGDTSRDNFGQVNTTNGSSDGGKGDIYDDMNTSRNSLRTDKLNKKYVKK